MQISKLFSRKVLKASRDANGDAAAIKEKLEGADFAALRSKYQGARWEKYLNFEKFVPFNVRLCRDIGLHQMPPLRLLDIGCGGGLFMYCAKSYGHHPVGLDIENELLGDMAKAFGVERRIGPIYAFKPVPIDEKFDAVSCIGPVFDWHRFPDSREPWTPAEWAFFLTDIRDRILTADGRVYLRLNRGDDARAKGEYFYDERLQRAFEHGHLRSSEILLDRPALDLAIERLAAYAAEAEDA